MTSLPTGTGALKAMRLTRRRHRVADLEWFEALYRVYLAAFLGGGMILFVSDMVGDAPLSADEIADLSRRGPAIGGVLLAIVLFMGARSGAYGGPLAVEEAEVRHVLLAPIRRRIALRRPAFQRLRSSTFSGMIVGGAIGQLVGRRVGSAIAPLVEWIMWGAAAGAAIGAAFVAVALVVHQMRISRPVISGVFGALVAWQCWSLVDVGNVPSPLAFIGRVALRPLVGGAGQLTGFVPIAACAALGIALLERMSLESLATRSALVSQLKFAVTMQDLRTVVLLRRQMSAEYSRQTPWIKVPRRMRHHVVVGRGAHGLVRFPLRRLWRMVLVTGAAGASLVLAWRGSTPYVVVAGMLLYVFGLDAVEALSQEIDQPDRTDSIPAERGLLHAQHLIVPALTALPALVVGVAVACVLEPSASTVGIGIIVGAPALLAGVAGAAINVVKGAPDPSSAATQGLALPPEMSGIGTVLRTAWPPTVSILGTLPLLSARFAHVNDEHVVGSAVRGAIGICLMLVLVAGWVRQRDAIRDWFRTMQTENRSSNRTQER